jgi:4-amino-4-deoxy-L-arabinose transferase-like glycosyltransferase
MASRKAAASKSGEDRALSARALRFARNHWQLLLVAGIMAGAFAVRLYYLHKHTEYTADSYYFLLLARAIRDTFTYTVRGMTHTKYNPGYPIAIWLGGYLTGGLERSANLIAVLGGTFTVLATYGIGRELFNRWAGVVAALIIAFEPTFLKWTSLPMTEGLFTFLFAAGVYLLITGCKRASPPRRILGAAAGGMCFLVRWEGILFLPLAVLIVLLYVKGSGLRYWEPPLMLFLFGLPIGIFVVRNLIVTGKVTSYIGEYRDYSVHVSYQVLKHRFKVYAWNGMSSAVFSVLFYLGAAWCLVRRKWKAFAVLAGWFALFVAMHLFWYYAYERFMAPAAPAVALVIGFLFVDLVAEAKAVFGVDGWLAAKIAGRPKKAPGPEGGVPPAGPGDDDGAGGEAAAEGDKGGNGKPARLTGPARWGLIVALVLSYVLLAASFVAMMTHGVARADTVLKQNYKAFADDHGGIGMKEAAQWLNYNAPGQLVAADAGPYFNWSYYPGDVLYMRPVPWDLPVEGQDVSWTNTPQRLYERGVRYLVIGQTEKGVDDELIVFGIVGRYRERLQEVASWTNHYDYPTPHDLTTTIFEVLPPG